MHEPAHVMLRDFLSVPTEIEADVHLSRILESVARPLVCRIVGSVLRDAPAADAEDAVADTLTDLLRRLRDLRRADADPIHDLRRYIVTAAYNRCHERLRERYPARNRLRNQLQYLCGHHPALAIWRTPNGAIVCGLREWAGRDPDRGERAEGVQLVARRDATAENRAQMTTLVPLLFRRVGAPLELDVLVAAIARIIDLDAQRAEVSIEKVELLAEPETAFELRVSLRQLWDDVRRLSLRQRIALLLNLRDVHGRECLSLMPLTGTATIREIAEAVEMPVEQFAALWHDLPLSDAAIAKLLGATPRQVIKLRRLARERLRRMERTILVTTR